MRSVTNWLRRGAWLLLCCPMAETRLAYAVQLSGKVTQINGETIVLASDSELLPRVNDKVEIFIELKAIKSTALVTTGSVTEVTGDSIVVHIDNPKATVVTGQLARIDSPQPMKKNDATMLPQPGATDDASSTVTFDELKEGQQSSNALAGYGIIEIRTGETHPIVYSASESQVVPAGRKHVMSAGSVSTRTSTLSLMFDRPLLRFEIVRIGVIRGGSLPKWRMEALDTEGNVIDATGEDDWGFDPNPKRFSVAGRGIGSIRIKADNRWGNGTFATYSALPIVELRFEDDAPSPGPPPLGPEVGPAKQGNRLDAEAVTRRVPANRAWTQTRLLLKSGDRAEISASGTIEAAPAAERAFYHQVPPEGRNERFDYLPQADLPALVLIGRIGNGPVFAVGKSLRLDVGPDQGNGELWLGINDDDVSDNTGEWLVQIRLESGARSPASNPEGVWDDLPPEVQSLPPVPRQ